MTLTQLSYIIEVANLRNFAKAAEKCFVTQPTLSMQIQKLESHLGILIFDRSKHPVIPTEIGEKIIEQARIVLRENEKITTIIKEETEEIGGIFKVGIIPTLAPYLLPLFVEELTKKYSNVEFIIYELQTAQIIEKLRRNELDSAILATPLYRDEIVEIPIFYEPFIGYVSNDHRLYKSKKINADDLNVNDLFLLKEGHCFRDHVLQICKNFGETKSTKFRSVNLEGTTLDTLMKMVDKNIGMTLIPYLAMKELDGTAKLKQLRKFQNPIPTREISIIYHKTQIRKKLVDILYSEIKNNLPKELLKAGKNFIVG